MAETAPTLAAGRPSYETADGRFDEDRLRKFVEDYNVPEDPDYPGCVPIPMTLEQFDNYEGGVEYWSRERGTALICRDGSPAHEIPGGRLPGLLTRVEMERGSPILCCGALKMVTVDGAGQTAEGMHPDQSVYLRPGAWIPSGRRTVIGRIRDRTWSSKSTTRRTCAATSLGSTPAGVSPRSGWRRPTSRRRAVRAGWSRGSRSTSSTGATIGRVPRAWPAHLAGAWDSRRTERGARIVVHHRVPGARRSDSRRPRRHRADGRRTDRRLHAPLAQRWP